MKKKILVFSLGGHLLSDPKAPWDFAKKFKNLILKNLGDARFYFVVGGGDRARQAQAVARKNGVTQLQALDEIGISATRLNAQIIKGVFGKNCPAPIFQTPQEAKSAPGQIIVGGGWKSGFSTDYVAVYLAKLLHCQTIINLSKIDYIFDKDPSKYANAKPLPNLNWQELRRLVGNKWQPGLNMPFDPLACQLAQKLQKKVVFLNGFNYQNLAKYLRGDKFKGSVIS